MRAARMLAPEALPVLGETAAPVEPGEGPFDYPLFWQHDEPLGVIRTLDDLHIHPGHDVLHGVAEVRSPVSAIGMKLDSATGAGVYGRTDRCYGPHRRSEPRALHGPA